ncbi:MAG: PAS domain-containing protein, partial [Coprobacillus sp.]
MLSTINLNFLIISNNICYEELLRNIKTQYHINICTHSYPTSQQLEEADIIICEYPSDFKNVVEGHFLAKILIVPHDKTESIDLQHYTHIWLSSMSQSLLEFNYLQLIDQVVEKKNSEVTEVYLNTLINSIPDLVWFKDLRGSHLKVNHAFGNAVGKTVEECTGRGHYYIWDLEPDEYADGEYVCLETEEEVIRKGETCLFDEKVKSKSGLRQFKTYKSPLYDSNGKMFGTVGIAKDVTDLHNISRELEIVLSSIPFATVLADDNANIVYANTSFYETFNIADDNKPLNYEEFCINTLKSSIEQLNQDKIFTVRNHKNELNYLRIQQQSLED